MVTLRPWPIWYNEDMRNMQWLENNLANMTFGCQVCITLHQVAKISQGNPYVSGCGYFLEYSVIGKQACRPPTSAFQTATLPYLHSRNKTEFQPWYQVFRPLQVFIDEAQKCTEIQNVKQANSESTELTIYLLATRATKRRQPNGNFISRWRITAAFLNASRKLPTSTFHLTSICEECGVISCPWSLYTVLFLLQCPEEFANWMQSLWFAQRASPSFSRVSIRKREIYTSAVWRGTIVIINVTVITRVRTLLDTTRIEFCTLSKSQVVWLSEQ